MWPCLCPGILENLLGKVLEAFQERADTLLGGAGCRALAEDSALAMQMAAEPAASRAGEPVAFFVGRSAEGIDHFVASILHSGFAKGGEAAELAILQRVLKVPAPAPDRPASAVSVVVMHIMTKPMHSVMRYFKAENLSAARPGCAVTGCDLCLVGNKVAGQDQLSSGAVSMQERPVRAAALLAKGDMTRHSNLAAMADSLDYLADVIQGAVLEHGDTHPATAEQPATPRARRASSDSFGSPLHRAASVVLDSLHHLADRCTALHSYLAYLASQPAAMTVG